MMEALAVFYARDLGRARRIVDRHVLDITGRCSTCQVMGCVLRAAAVQALAEARRDGAR